MNKKNTKKYNKRLMANKMCFDPYNFLMFYQEIDKINFIKKEKKYYKSYQLVENISNPEPKYLMFRKNQLLHVIGIDKEGYKINESNILFTDKNKIKIRNEKGKVVEKLIELYFKVLSFKFINPIRKEDLLEQEQY